MNIDKFNKIKQVFNIHLDSVLGKMSRNNTEYEIIKYSLNNGKRLRPCISIDLCIQLGGKLDEVINFAVALELIHTASLIIDDLPCMDDDNIRRNQQSFHIKYGEKYAQICSNKLLKYAIKLIYTNFENKPVSNLIYILKNISKNLGVLGVAGGQYMDTLSIDTLYINKDTINKKADKKLLKNVLELKTSSLFEISFVGGYLSGNNSLNNIGKFEKLGNLFGLIFQIYDDFLDIEQDKERINNNLIDCNYINNFGQSEALAELNKLIDNFKSDAVKLNIFTEVLEEIINYIINKINNIN